MLPFVMCVDDDPILLFLHDHILRNKNFCSKVIKFEDSRKAIEYLLEESSKPINEANIPNLLFLDIHMPNMDAWDFLDEFKKMIPSLVDKIKIVIVSSSTNPEDRYNALNNPQIIGFIQKPISENALKELKRLPQNKSFFKLSKTA
jgi:response regulator RpfG family c-di-GMP phosphodiesterase